MLKALLGFALVQQTASFVAKSPHLLRSAALAWGSPGVPGVQQARPVAVVLHARRDKGSLAPTLAYDEEDDEAKAAVGGNEDAMRAIGMGGGVTEEAATQPLDAVAESYDEDLGGVNRTAVEGGADLTTVEESDEDETVLFEDKIVRVLDLLFVGFE